MPHEPDLTLVYGTPGYSIPGGFGTQATDFSGTKDLAELGVVPDEEYYARDAIEPERGVVDVPASLDEVFDRFKDAEHERRDQLLRAAYWFDAAYRTWNMTKSLSYLATINAIEELIPSVSGDPCPTCQRDRGPGPTKRFRNFVELHSASTTTADRKAMYALRSALVHGGRLHALDVPDAWGALLPLGIEHGDLHGMALRTARSVILSWWLGGP